MEVSTGTKLVEDCRPMMASRQSTRIHNQKPRFCHCKKKFIIVSLRRHTAF